MMPGVESNSKRRTHASSSNARKKVKRSRLSSNDLPWKPVPRPTGSLTKEDGILELEEVDDVEIVYEETEHGKIAKFNVLSEPPQASETTDNESPQASVTKMSPVPSFDSAALLSAWHSVPLHPLLMQSLYNKSFSSPTPIQARTIPLALAGRDIVGVAETGSGKTLAYGLPILHYLLSNPHLDITSSEAKSQQRRLRALILAPTRELAFQVSSHLRDCLDSMDASIKGKEVEAESRSSKDKIKQAKTPPSPKAPPRVSVAAIVGGMSAHKQRRILGRGVDVLVATPGRLWDIMEQDDTLSSEIKSLRFLVLDEADRMIETGHFAELDNILRFTLRYPTDDQPPHEFTDNIDEETNDPEKMSADEGGQPMQTFVFSATLSKDLQRNLTKRLHPRFKKGKRQSPASTLDDLLLRLDFRDPEPVVVDISPEGAVISALTECKIECLSADKDVYLYYFLLHYPGRSLVFLSSIDGIRRLMPLMELLQLKAFALHSQLEQRQRLKNLDRFKFNKCSVLLATDIAARGLDIPAVDHVIHYQVPRSADAYVHRKGRTARAMNKGFSMLMCAPDERSVVKGLLKSLGREENDIPPISVDLDILDKLKARVQLARKIDGAQHKINKKNHDRNWIKAAAEAMEIEVDSESDSNLEDEDDKHTRHKRKKQDLETAPLKTELRSLLSQPLLARGISAKFITSGSRPVADTLMAGEYHERILGVRKMKAESAISAKKRKAEVRTEEEEWCGIQS